MMISNVNIGCQVANGKLDPTPGPYDVVSSTPYCAMVVHKYRQGYFHLFANRAADPDTGAVFGV
jgi:hypothetical protein